RCDVRQGQLGLLVRVFIPQSNAPAKLRLPRPAIVEYPKRVIFMLGHKQLSMASVRPNGRHLRPFCKAVQKRQGRHNLAAEQACATGHKGNFSFKEEWI
ncbi:MAG: hypothetical protein WCH98_08290, partial [Verrucomicrobiota bacterium]